MFIILELKRLVTIQRKQNHEINGKPTVTTPKNAI